MNWGKTIGSPGDILTLAILSYSLCPQNFLFTLCYLLMCRRDALLYKVRNKVVWNVWEWVFISIFTIYRRVSYVISTACIHTFAFRCPLTYLCQSRFSRNSPFRVDSCHKPSMSSPWRIHTGPACPTSSDTAWSWTGTQRCLWRGANL